MLTFLRKKGAASQFWYRSTGSHSVCDTFPCWASCLCPLSVPDQLSTPPRRMPACHHVFPARQVRYCVIKSFTHMLQVTDVDQPPYLRNPWCDFSPTIIFRDIDKHFGLCFQLSSSKMCVYMSFINRRELLLNPLDFLPRAAPCPPLLISTAPKRPPKTHSEHCSPEQAR